MSGYLGMRQQHADNVGERMYSFALVDDNGDPVSVALPTLQSYITVTWIKPDGSTGGAGPLNEPVVMGGEVGLYAIELDKDNELNHCQVAIVIDARAVNAGWQYLPVGLYGSGGFHNRD